MVLESYGAFGVRCNDIVAKIQEEGNLNGILNIQGLKIKSYLYKALAFSLQSGNSFIAVEGSKRSRKRLKY